MDFDISFNKICPVEIVQQVKQLDMRQPTRNYIFDWIFENADTKCQVISVVAIAQQLDQSTSIVNVDEFSSNAATYAPLFSKEHREVIRDAFLRMPYSDTIAFNYFNALRYNGIDIREKLKGRVNENWTFTHPRGNDAATWNYYLYLASIDECGAFNKLSKKIAQTKSGNDVTNFLKSLANLKSEGSKAILQQYINDSRRADGPEGPGMMISETVKIYLEAY